MGMKSVKTNEAHQAFRNDIAAVLEKHKERLSSLDMLAVTSHLVGQVVAMQDQRTVTPAMAMELVAANIEAGNQEVIAMLMNAPAAGQG